MMNDSRSSRAMLLSLIIMTATTTSLTTSVSAANLVVEVEDDPNNEKYNRAWSLWKFCGCATATVGEGTMGGLGAIADAWSMGSVFSDMPYDTDYMPLDPFMVHLNVTWLYSGDFYSGVVANYLSSDEHKATQTSSSDGKMTDEDYQKAETYVYGTLAPQEQEVHLEYIHIGWDTVDEEGVFSFITDFRGHIPIRKGDEVCWDGMHMYNVSATAIETVKNIVGFGGVGLDFHVNEGLNLCKDVTGW